MVDKLRSRRRLTVEDRRRELLQACLKLLGTRPWDEIAMIDVADAAGVSKPLLYHYFSTKSDLYLATVEWAANDLRNATAPDLDLPLDQRLLRSLATHLDWIDANDLAYRAILQGGNSGDLQVECIVETSRNQVVVRLAEAFDVEQITPTLRIALRGWVGFLESACLEWLETRPITKAELARLLAASVTNGPLRAATGLG